ncbi:Extracytoplasmic solute receptor protein yiaO [Leclercia adecarboxylata]|uniref:Extracytoplasmic solute receptor protein yiaO n=1 Tax=Leclercia adecarboxylata TaxID=83655 RepID=A0A4U9IUI3_9ENTR|nr:Extracytoplasmic solute receptor protein yiaO [Leclercia adecarboxylata]
MKIRVQGSPVALATLKDMGANSVAMGVSEVYSGMQTGVIDGAENNPPTFIAHNYMPVAKNYTLSGHFITPEMLLYSKVKWDKLSADEQEKIKTLAREAQMEQRKLWQEYNSQALEKMKGRRRAVPRHRQGSLYQSNRAGACPVWRQASGSDESHR